jgi:phosphate transport system protein
MEEMGRLVADQTERALGALVSRQAELASQVIAGDARVNALQIEIDDRALKLLALQAPAARDLRLVVAAIKANTDLERIGDQAVNIAETALRLTGTPALPHEVVLAELGRLAVAMTRDALTSFLDRDVELARRVLAQDDEADRLKVEIIRQMIEAMTTDGTLVDHALGLVLVSRNLERVADHATNMAEDAIFLVEARDVRHHHADGPSPVQ